LCWYLKNFEYLGSVYFNPMFRILIEILYRSFFYSKFCFQWAEGFYTETLMGLFGEQGEVAEEVAGGSAQADPTPLAPAQFHPEEVP
jgi:hypothetical protein